MSKEEIDSFIWAYKSSGLTTAKDAGANPSIKDTDLIEFITQNINNLKRIPDTNSDGYISIGDYPDGKVKFKTPAIKEEKTSPDFDIKFLLKNDSKIDIKKLNQMSDSDIRQMVSQFVLAADSQENIMQNGVNKAVPHDGKVNGYELAQQLLNENNHTQKTSWIDLPPAPNGTEAPPTVINNTNPPAGAKGYNPNPPQQPAESTTEQTQPQTTTTTTSGETAITHADGSSKTIGKVWEDNKGLVLGVGGVILGGLMALFTGGSGWLMVLFGILGGVGGVMADEGAFDGKPSSDKSSSSPSPTQSENQEKSKEQGAAQEQVVEKENLKYFALKNGDMSVRGTVEGNTFTVQGVSVKRKDGNWNHQDNGELIYTPISSTTLTFPINGNDLGSDAKSTKNLDVLQRLGNLGNGEDIYYNTVSQNTLNQARDAAKGVTLSLASDSAKDLSIPFANKPVNVLQAYV